MQTMRVCRQVLAAARVLLGHCLQHEFAACVLSGVVLLLRLRAGLHAFTQPWAIPVCGRTLDRFECVCARDTCALFV
jgi:hypothetical protein